METLYCTHLYGFGKANKAVFIRLNLELVRNQKIHTILITGCGITCSKSVLKVLVTCMHLLKNMILSSVEHMGGGGVDYYTEYDLSFL